MKFLSKLKKTATETYQLLREVCGEDTLSWARVFEWHRRFLGGREDMEDDERPGRLVTMKTDENVDKETVFWTDTLGEFSPGRNFWLLSARFSTVVELWV
jgi:hypothetical protein